MGVAPGYEAFTGVVPNPLLHGDHARRVPTLIVSSAEMEDGGGSTAVRRMERGKWTNRRRATANVLVALAARVPGYKNYANVTGQWLRCLFGIGFLL